MKSVYFYSMKKSIKNKGNNVSNNWEIHFYFKIGKMGYF